MAAAFAAFCSRRAVQELQPFVCFPGFMQCRSAAKKSAGSTSSQGKNKKGKHLGPKRYEGEHVIPGTVLMRQRGLKFHPGQNVGVGRDKTLYALAEGIVRYKRELWEPHPRAKICRHGVVQERKFIHVIDRFPFKGPKLVPVNEVYKLKSSGT